MAPAAPLPTTTAQKAAQITQKVVVTFLVAFAGVYVAGLLAGGSTALSDLSLLQKAATAGLAAAGQLVVALFGTQIGNTNTSDVLPARYDPATKVWTAQPHDGTLGASPAGRPTPRGRQ